MIEIYEEVKSKRMYMRSRKEDITQRDKKEERKERTWNETADRRMG
jgi:hypothetical protein